MFGQLLWKEYKTQRPIIWLGIIFLVAPFVIYFGIYSSTGFVDGFISESLIFPILASIALSQITFLVLGGSIIATERQNRSLDFQLLLPPTRSHLLISKSVFCAIVAASIWLCLIFLVEVVYRLCIPDVDPDSMKSLRYTCVGAAVTGIAMFGVAWMGSSFLESVAIPTVTGLAVAIAIYTVCSYITTVAGWSEQLLEQYFWKTLAVIYSVIGLASFIAGWCIFKRQ